MLQSNVPPMPSAFEAPFFSLARRNARSGPPPPKGCSVSDPCVFECVPPPYIPPRRPRKPPGRVPHSTFLADLLPIKKLTKITFFYLQFSRLLESPMCLKCGPCHVFFMFFTFRKVSFFLSFLEVKSRPRTSKKLTFDPQFPFVFYV